MTCTDIDIFACSNPFEVWRHYNDHFITNLGLYWL